MASELDFPARGRVTGVSGGVVTFVPAVVSELLHELGFAEQHVRLQVYAHVLESTADVVEWTKGTSLTRFRRVLTPASEILRGCQIETSSEVRLSPAERTRSRASTATAAAARARRISAATRSAPW